MILLPPTSSALADASICQNSQSGDYVSPPVPLTKVKPDTKLDSPMPEGGDLPVLSGPTPPTSSAEAMEAIKSTNNDPDYQAPPAEDGPNAPSSSAEAMEAIRSTEGANPYDSVPVPIDIPKLPEELDRFVGNIPPWYFPAGPLPIPFPPIPLPSGPTAPSGPTGPSGPQPAPGSYTCVLLEIFEGKHEWDYTFNATTQLYEARTTGTGGIFLNPGQFMGQAPNGIPVGRIARFDIDPSLPYPERFFNRYCEDSRTEKSMWGLSGWMMVVSTTLDNTLQGTTYPNPKAAIESLSARLVDPRLHVVTGDGWRLACCRDDFMGLGGELFAPKIELTPAFVFQPNTRYFGYMIYIGLEALEEYQDGKLNWYLYPADACQNNPYVSTALIGPTPPIFLAENLGFNLTDPNNFQFFTRVGARNEYGVSRETHKYGDWEIIATQVNAPVFGDFAGYPGLWRLGPKAPSSRMFFTYRAGNWIRNWVATFTGGGVRNIVQSPGPHSILGIGNPIGNKIGKFYNEATIVNLKGILLSDLTTLHIALEAAFGAPLGFLPFGTPLPTLTPFDGDYYEYEEPNPNPRYWTPPILGSNAWIGVATPTDLWGVVFDVTFYQPNPASILSLPWNPYFPDDALTRDIVATTISNVIPAPLSPTVVLFGGRSIWQPDPSRPVAE